MRQKILGIYSAIIWLIISLVVSNTYVLDNAVSHNVYTLLCVISYGLCLINWVGYGCRVTSLYVFFVAYLMFCNLGQSLLYALQVPQDLLYLFYKLDVGEVARMLRFQYVCIAALNFGTVWYISKPQRVVPLSALQKNYARIQNKYSKKYDNLAIALLAISFIYLLYEGFNMLTMRQTMGYHDFFDSGRGQISNVFTLLVRFLALYLSIWAIFKKLHVKLVYGVLIVLISIYMMTGSRGLSISYVGILLILTPITHAHLFKRKYLWIWILGGTFAFSLLGVIGANRNNLGVGIFSSDNDMNANIISTVAEMGGSARPAVYAMEAADRGMFNYHTIFATIIRAVIPFSSYVPEIKANNVVLSEWVTDYAQNFSSGLGFSCIGELYVNYGKWGWIFMLFYGYFIAYAENESYRKIMKGDLLYPLVLLTFLCTMVPWARSEFVRCINVIRYGLYLIVGKLLVR